MKQTPEVISDYVQLGIQVTTLRRLLAQDAIAAEELRCATVESKKCVQQCLLDSLHRV